MQENGGAVFMLNGELVFDGVAISDTSATVRCPSAARAGRPLWLWARAAAPDRCRAQRNGGAVRMVDGAVTFRGSSTILRTRAVRPARRNHSRTRTWSTRLVLALLLALVFDLVPSMQPVEQECAVAVLVK